MIKKRLPLVFIMLLVFIFSNTSKSLAFRDTQNHWSSEYVTVLNSKNIINGYEDGTFKPDNNITRAEYYSIINRLAGYNKTYAVSFSDVKRTDWFYEEVAKGIKAGYITPTTGNLHPNRPITREDAMRIIGYVYNVTPNPQGLDKFGDKGNFKNETRGYAGALVNLGIVDGFPDGNIYPTQQITRGEISKLLSVCIEKLGAPNNNILMDSEIKFGPRNLYD